MPELIRPTLFMIARLGLFLAVVAWIVGTWTVAGMRVGPLSIASGPGGWEIRRWDTQVWDQVLTVFYSLQVDAPDATPTLPAIWGIFIYHWLVVSVFTIINVCLYHFYRKRGKGLVADE